MGAIINSNQKQRWLLVAPIFVLLALLAGLILAVRSEKDPSGSEAVSGPAAEPGENGGQSLESSAEGEAVAGSLQGPPVYAALQELPVYAALQDFEGYAEHPRQPGDPPTTVALRFGIDDKPGFFWLSLLEENNIHYANPSGEDPDYNKKLYSRPVLERSCYAILSDSQTFIIQYITDTPPTTEEEIVAAQDELLLPLVVLNLAEIEGLGLFQPVSDTKGGCWDLTTV